MTLITYLSYGKFHFIIDSDLMLWVKEFVVMEKHASIPISTLDEAEAFLQSNDHSLFTLLARNIEAARKDWVRFTFSSLREIKGGILPYAFSTFLCSREVNKFDHGLISTTNHKLPISHPLPFIQQGDVCGLLQVISPVCRDVELDPVSVTQGEVALLVALSKFHLHLQHSRLMTMMSRKN